MLTVADLCPYWVWPPTSGGPLRVYNINRVVAQRARVLQFSARPTLGHQQSGRTSWLGSRICQVSDGYVEYQYFHPLILGTSYLLYRLNLHSDLFLSSILRWLSPSELHKVIRQASIIQVEHPWLFKLALHLANGRPVVYVAHNVEAELWEALASKQGTLVPKLALRPRKLEREAARCASAVVSMSRTDADILVNECDANPTRIYIIPNGVDFDTRKHVTPQGKASARLRLGLDDRPVFLFIGSDHYPNKEALGHIRRWQAQLGPQLGVQFVVVGGVGRAMKSTEHMRIEGFVEDVTDYLMAADIALNPLTSGSGNSLKAVEYLACGLPTISTATGIRGLELTPGQDVLVGDVCDFPRLMTRMMADQALQSRLSHNGRKAVEREYGWKSLGKRMFDVYERVDQCESA